MQLGAVTPVFFAFRDREHVLLIESVTGGRFHPNFDRIGGLKDDLPKGFIDETRLVMRKIRGFCDENEDLLIGNEIFQERTRGVGIIPREVALQYGLSGPNMRASGVDWDLRRDQVLPMAWDKVDWRVWTHPTATASPAAGCACRRRGRRPRSSTSSSTGSRQGRSWPRCRASSRCRRARRGSRRRTRSVRWATTSCPGDLGPFRVKIRSASFNNISVVPWVLRGVYVPDIITILASCTSSSETSIGDERARRGGSYWGQSLLRVLGGIVAVLIPAGTIVYVFLFKMMSFMQSRLGPMEAGPYGSLQLVAEVGKWLQKEDTAPERADHSIFKLAPLIVLGSTFLLVAAVPFGPDAWITNFQAGVFYALAVSSISVLGILVAGWSSANKYSLLGGLRAAGRLIAYELPLVLAAIGVVIQAGTMNLQGIVVAQNGEIFGWDGLGNPYVLTQFIGFLVFMVAVQAELTQPPFDMPIAESELVSGYMTSTPASASSSSSSPSSPPSACSR